MGHRLIQTTHKNNNDMYRIYRGYFPHITTSTMSEKCELPADLVDT